MKKNDIYRVNGCKFAWNTTRKEWALIKGFDSNLVEGVRDGQCATTMVKFCDWVLKPCLAARLKPYRQGKIFRLFTASK